MSRQYLLELGLEEIPAHLVTPSMNQLAERVDNFLSENRLSYESMDSFSTPRRLAIRVNGLAEKQDDISEKSKGPAKKIALDNDGNWSKAAMGFAKGQGVSPDALFFEELKGVEYVYANRHEVGKLAEDILPNIAEVVSAMTFPVSMHWANYNFKFIRPVHWIVSLLDDKDIPVTVFDVASGNQSRGHRFLGQDTVIKNAASYEQALKEQFVLVDPSQRKSLIIQQIGTIEKENGWVIPLDGELLEEVNNIVEYPTAFVGNFDEKYLVIPSEVLITSMKEHQRYFEVLDKENNLQNHFVSVRNGNADYIDNVARGNEKVLRARLEDAEFFYNEDLKLSIETCVEKLKNVTFHVKIGSIYEKMQRVAAISRYIGEQVGLKQEELDDLARASAIYKFDLMTNMVNEFPELQGIIGEKYALIHGEKPTVAQAIREHYLPNSSDSELPVSDIGSVLAISDKLDSLLTFFAVGLVPKGSNDPYALRRQAYGIIRILDNKRWAFPIEAVEADIYQLINDNTELYGIKLTNNSEDISKFIKSRVKQWLLSKKIRHDIIDSIINSDQDDVTVMFDAANMLKEKAEQPQFKAAIEALTRVLNLASKNPETDFIVNESLFDNDAEQKLHDAIEKIREDQEILTLKQRFDRLQELTPLIEAYFEDTMVMTDDEAVKKNRLNQLSQLAKLTTSIAKLEELVTK
ncbi:glycine--tRNA ligase subunit beta [Vagococcus vulneris]|uniref:Glycine--tRNA ligase beta subunit n=1 Tax=Vagococcus vulneris TaxID=1977869 RepID=A0A430A226_9ENTE|nr:glycine--tRNA ligase subunit beta [Vagococcus vulneris]RSU00490.1 glycine--tRNA ligase subunit beta [Vagococcus vulneris]